MIEQGVFKNEWAALCERFRMTGDKEPSQLMMRRYYRYLSARMETEAFREACEILYVDHDFFPKPSDFVDAAHEDADVRAVQEWGVVLDMAKDHRRAKPSERLSMAGQAALEEVGGLRRLAMMDRDDLDFRRKDFLEAYEAAVAGYESLDRQIASMTPEGQKQFDEATKNLTLLQ